MMVDKAMVVYKDIPSLQAQVAAWRRDDQRIAFVPTMGNLHDGHLALIKEGFNHADRVVVSIFVNPLQFAAGEDLASYPRTLQQDIARLQTLGVDCLFTPDVETIYGDDEKAVLVEVTGLGDILCGASREGHFTGVSTVVAKLFNIVQPDVAIFGEKDHQQLTIIRRMVSLLYMPVEIIAVDTRREDDGLAMSSRNRYLTPQQRMQAPLLYQCLQDAAQCIRDGDCDIANIERMMWAILEEAGFEPEYFTVRDRESLSRVEEASADCVILVAARLGKTRLIDNIRVNQPV